MSKLCYSVLLLLLGLISQINCSTVPVFIWGSNTPTSFLPSLNRLESEEFSTLVHSQQEESSITLIFVENNLSTEDLSQCKLKTQTCFENLKKISHKSYLPNVVNPLEALKLSDAKQKSILLSNDGELSEQIDPAMSNIYFIYLDDIENIEDYAIHDEIINEIYNSIAAKYENVIAIYTARYPSFEYSGSSLSRKARQTVDTNTTVQRVIQDTDKTHILFALSGLHVVIDKVVTTIDIQTITMTLTDLKAPQMGLNFVAGNIQFVMNIVLSAGTWEVYDATYSADLVQLHPVHRVMAAGAHSFACLELRMKSPKLKLELIFENIQIQPNFDTTTTEFKTFGRAWQCVGFFSAGIWGGLFIAFLFLFILTIGITAIMSIKTMTKFDDPKGKQITINASD
ncbi:unnamed protein product [Diamesa hyperborea]